MRRPLALAALPLVALIACSKDNGGDDLCYCPDAGAFDLGDPREDRPTPDLGAVDGGLDASAEDRPDAPLGTEPAPIVDGGTDRGGFDSGEDVAADGAPMDLGGVDSGTDVVAVSELPAADVADVPADAGPVVYDLDAVRSEMSAVLLWRLVCRVADCSMSYCDRTVTSATPAECRLASDGLHFGTTACGTLTGLVPLGPSAMGVTLGTGPVSRSTTVIARAGTEYVAGSARRRNFHVQVDMPAGDGPGGLTGIPGRTVSSTLGDVWLFGCRVE